MGEVSHGSLLQLLLEHCDFLNIDISQGRLGSVVTRLRCGGIFKYELVANLPVSLPVKEFWKSVNICGSYGQEFGVLFFWDTVYNMKSNVISWSQVLLAWAFTDQALRVDRHIPLEVCHCYQDKK